MPIADRHLEYAKEVNLNLTSAEIRSEVDSRSEKLGAKIRDAQMQKIPYMLILGDKEIETNMISERGRSGKDYGQQPLQEFIKNIKIEIENKTLS